MIEALLALALGPALVALWIRRVGSPDHTAGDCEEYQRAARGDAPRPFCWRWLIPALAGDTPNAWRRPSMAYLAMLPFLLYDYLPKTPSTLLVVLVVGLLPPIWERPLKVTYLVDAPALAFALAAACDGGPRWMAIGFALLAGATRETAPLFAALWAWSPWPLVGLLAVPWWRRGVPPWRHAHLYVKPWRRFAAQRWRQGFSLTYVLMWGGLLPAFAALDLRASVTLAVAAVPLFRSIDTARLWVPWAMPPLAAILCSWSPEAALGCLLLGVVLSSTWVP